MESPEPNPPAAGCPNPVRSGAARQALRLGLLFATAYFIQGIGEPGEGLIAQPIRSLLKSWGHSAGSVALFWSLLSLPWSVKPLYGLLSDFVPLLGSRRRSYLILTTAATALGFGYLYLVPPSSNQLGLLLVLLIVPTIGVAFSDVVIDALMIEYGQPLGLTGRLQSIQWTAIYAATIATGLIGGWLSQHGRQEWGFAICGAATLVTLVMAMLVVREPPRSLSDGTSGSVGDALRTLGRTLRNPGVRLAGGFLLLWNFNPFSSSVLYMYCGQQLNFSEQFQGNLTSLFSVAAVVASIAYGFYCRRVPFPVLIHLAIATGVLATLVYWALTEQRSAIAITLIVGFTYMTGSLIQLDLAARLCPPNVAGTVFATLMSLSNLSILLSAALGGLLYDAMAESWGSRGAFNVLVGLGAAFTAACWLMMPLLRKIDWQSSS